MNILLLDGLPEEYEGISLSADFRNMIQVDLIMQERDSETFIIATANDVSQLPAELTRKGRFSENFFVDLGSYEERMETLRIHTRRYLKDAAEGIDVKYLTADRRQ